MKKPMSGVTGPSLLRSNDGTKPAGVRIVSGWSNMAAGWRLGSLALNRNTCKQGPPACFLCSNHGWCPVGSTDILTLGPRDYTQQHPRPGP